MALRRKTYYRDKDWKPGAHHLTAKDSGRIDPRRLLKWAGQGNPIRKVGEQWNAFVADVRNNGVREPVTVFVKPGREPLIDEGNHRVLAAIEARRRSIPVDIYYYGGSEESFDISQHLRSSIRARSAGRRFRQTQS